MARPVMLQRQDDRRLKIPERPRSRQDVFAEFLSVARARGLLEEAQLEDSTFVQNLYDHFEKLPRRYALNVNTNSLDVLQHKRLLDEVRKDNASILFQFRPVHYALSSASSLAESVAIKVPHKRKLQVSVSCPNFNRSGSSLAQAAFVPNPGFATLPCAGRVLGNGAENDESMSSSSEGSSKHQNIKYEVTIACQDQPRLLSRFGDALGDIGLNILEAHVFNTTDGFALDVFIVSGWSRMLLGGSFEEQFSSQVQKSFSQPRPDTWFKLLPPFADPSQSAHSPEPVWYRGHPSSVAGDQTLRSPLRELNLGQGLTGPPEDRGQTGDWEVGPEDLKLDAIIHTSALSTVYLGRYYGQDVAVKVLRDMQRERSEKYIQFVKEVAILRKVRHRNIIALLGANLRPPQICLVFEYMAGGSVHEYILSHMPLPLSTILGIAIDVSRGMDYLHRHNILHRDLKSANLLMDEHGAVKLGDFGLSRLVEAPSPTNLTPETGTYRWMAPEVIEHKPYDTKADVYSFAIVLWELLVGRLPYESMRPIEAAVAVVQQGLRPQLPPSCPSFLARIIQACWHPDPTCRPSFSQLLPQFQSALQALKDGRELDRDNAPATSDPPGPSTSSSPSTSGGPSSQMPKRPARGLLSKLLKPES